jgi:hypothetical protein
MNEQTFATRHFGCATFLRYALGDAAHLSTDAAGAPSFKFADDGRCRELADQFFSDESVSIGNAREFLECSRALRITSAKAQDAPDRKWTQGERTA